MNISRRQSWIISSVLVTVLAAAGPALAEKGPTLDQRVTLIEHKLDNAALGEMANQMESLRQQIQNLRGDLEQMQRQLQDLQDRQRSIYSDVDSRLRALEQGSNKTAAGTMQRHAAESGHTTPPATGGKVADGKPGTAPDTSGGANQASSGSNKSEANTQLRSTEEPSTAGSAGSATSQAGEYQAYERAFNTLKDGRYAKAQQEFREFLQEYPSGQYADNACYWLGESYYVGRHFDQALEQFQKVLNDFPNSGKRPGAALKIGYIQYEQGHLDQARKTLGDVIQQYPNSTAAVLAQQRLRLIDGQKH